MATLKSFIGWVRATSQNEMVAHCGVVPGAARNGWRRIEDIWVMQISPGGSQDLPENIFFNGDHPPALAEVAAYLRATKSKWLPNFISNIEMQEMAARGSKPIQT